VRLITRSYNWTDRCRWIVEAARKVRQKRIVLDGEAVVLGVDGVSDFTARRRSELSAAAERGQEVREALSPANLLFDAIVDEVREATSDAAFSRR
jgi:ATP-dependent DNA ligase